MTEQTGVFQDITLKWADKDGQPRSYKIPADRVMMALAVIEEHVTLAELGRFMVKKSAPLARLAQAYGALLRFAGCDITDEQVYVDLFKKTDSGVSSQSIANVIHGLLALMIPPDTIASADKEAKDGKQGKRKATA